MSPNTQPALLPCPFCGGDAAGPFPHGYHHTIHFGVECVECAAESYGTSNQMAVDAWNDRTPLAEARAHLAPAPTVPNTGCNGMTTADGVFHPHNPSLPMIEPHNAWWIDFNNGDVQIPCPTCKTVGPHSCIPQAAPTAKRGEHVRKAMFMATDLQGRAEYDKDWALPILANYIEQLEASAHLAAAPGVGPITSDKSDWRDHYPSNERDYIPLAGGYEFQTKGKGSTARLLLPNGDRVPFADAWHVIAALEAMVRAQHAALTAPAQPDTLIRDRLVYAEKTLQRIGLGICKHSTDTAWVTEWETAIDAICCYFYPQGLNDDVEILLANAPITTLTPMIFAKPESEEAWHDRSYGNGVLAGINVVMSAINPFTLETKDFWRRDGLKSVEDMRANAQQRIETALAAAPGKREGGL